MIECPARGERSTRDAQRAKCYAWERTFYKKVRSLSDKHKLTGVVRHCKGCADMNDTRFLQPEFTRHMPYVNSGLFLALHRLERGPSYAELEFRAALQFWRKGCARHDQS